MLFYDGIYYSVSSEVYIPCFLRYLTMPSYNMQMVYLSVQVYKKKSSAPSGTEP